LTVPNVAGIAIGGLVLVTGLVLLLFTPKVLNTLRKNLRELYGANFEGAISSGSIRLVGILALPFGLGMVILGSLGSFG
jgi:hypothetical protein